MARDQTIVRRFIVVAETSNYTFVEARARRPSLRTAESVLDSLLGAHRAGTLDEWQRRHPRIAAWIDAQWLRPLRGAAGDLLPAGQRAAALSLLLRWAKIGRAHV